MESTSTRVKIWGAGLSTQSIPRRVCHCSCVARPRLWALGEQGLQLLVRSRRRRGLLLPAPLQGALVGQLHAQPDLELYVARLAGSLQRLRVSTARCAPQQPCTRSGAPARLAAAWRTAAARPGPLRRASQRCLLSPPGWPTGSAQAQVLSSTTIAGAVLLAEPARLGPRSPRHQSRLHLGRVPPTSFQNRRLKAIALSCSSSSRRVSCTAGVRVAGLASFFSLACARPLSASRMRCARAAAQAHGAASTRLPALGTRFAADLQHRHACCSCSGARRSQHPAAGAEEQAWGRAPAQAPTLQAGTRQAARCRCSSAGLVLCLSVVRGS